MAKKAMTNAPAPKKVEVIFAHVFEESCMNYYGSYSGEAQDEILTQIEQDLRENENEISDYVVMFGPIYQIKAKGIELEKVDNPRWLGGVEMR